MWFIDEYFLLWNIFSLCKFLRKEKYLNSKKMKNLKIFFQWKIHFNKNSISTNGKKSSRIQHKHKSNYNQCRLVLVIITILTFDTIVVSFSINIMLNDSTAAAQSIKTDTTHLNSCWLCKLLHHSGCIFLLSRFQLQSVMLIVLWVWFCIKWA